MPPINVQINRALAAAVRRSMVLPSAAFPPAPPLPEDTSEETIRNFQVAQALPAPRAAAQDDLNSRASAQRAAAAGAPLEMAAGFGNIGAYTGAVATIAGRSEAMLFDFIVKELYLTVASNDVAAAIDLVGWQLVVTRTADQTIANLQSGIQLARGDNFTSDGLERVLVQSQGQQILSYFYALRSQPFPAGYFIHFVRTVNAQVSINASLVVAAALTLGVPAATFLPPIGRTTFTINTAPPAPRTAAPKTPRAARINISQGGRIINQRVIAWTSLDPDIKRDWFNFQVGGAHDPNIEWIP